MLKSNTLILGFVIVLALLLINPFEVCSEDSGVKSKGIVHNIAGDRLVERVGGLYQPEGLDKYMKRRFDQLEDRLGELENQMGEMLTILQKLDSQRSGTNQVLT